MNTTTTQTKTSKAGERTHSPLVTATRAALGFERATAKNTIAEEFCDVRSKDVDLIRMDFRNGDLAAAIHGMKIQIAEWENFLAATESVADWSGCLKKCGDPHCTLAAGHAGDHSWMRGPGF